MDILEGLHSVPLIFAMITVKRSDFMFEKSISVLKKAISEVKEQQLRVSEDCREGLINEKEALVMVIRLQNDIVDLEDSVRILEDICSDEGDFEREEEAFE